jgi:hypothetical protein
MHWNARFAVRRRGLLAACTAVLLSTTALTAQAAPLAGHWVVYPLRSGNHANPTPVEGVVFRRVIAVDPTSPWLRLHFSRTELSPGSYLRITSMLDGDVQTLHQIHLEQWRNSTAYFNGHALLLEIVAGPLTATNSVEIEKVEAGDAPAVPGGTDTICGPNDNRTLSSNAAVGRLLPSGCTGWIINQGTGNDRCHLTAGHCFSASSTVLQFNVPASGANCALVHPPAASQFSINASATVFTDGGPGNDYAVFKCFPNSTSGLTTFQAQGTVVTITTSAPAPSSTLRMTGYGVDGTNIDNATGNSCTCNPGSGTGQRTQVQQTTTGAYLGNSGSSALYQVDTCGGNSGSPVFHEATGQAFVIHTHAGCSNPVGSTANSGTLLSLAGVQAAISTVCSGGPGLPNNECSGAVAVVNGTNGPFSSSGATSSAPTWPCIAAPNTGGADVWYRYTAPCTAMVTIDTCTAVRNFDTVLQVFSGTCAGLTSIACNDDLVGCGNGLGSSVTVNVTGAVTYYIRVGGYNSASGSFELRVNGPGCGPANDECAGALALSLGTNGPFANSSATTSAPAWPCAAGTNDVWFRYVATCTAPFTFTTCTPTRGTFDTTLQVFSGSCGALVSLGCDDDGCDVRGSTVTANLVASQTYWVRVGGFNNATGPFDVVVRAGTGNGSFMTVANGCGPTTITASGSPNLNGMLSFQLGNIVGTPFMRIGFQQVNLPICPPQPCQLGPDFFTARGGATLNITIPCDGGLIGVTLGVQGVDLLGVGGCMGLQVTVTDSIWVTIG